MSDDTNVDINVNVDGTASLREAANALAQINTKLGDVARSLGGAIRGLDKLEQSLAGVGRKSKSTFKGMEGDAQNYAKIISAASAAQPRNLQGQFISKGTAASTIANATQANNKIVAAQVRANYQLQQNTKNVQSNSKAQQANNEHLSRQRYALYDVAAAYGVVSASLLGASVYSVKLAADFESAFTNVQRTSDGSTAQLQDLRGELVELSTQIPLTFAELSEIATLGNQLGIQADAVDEFTETTAKFAAVTGVSIDTAATAFGSLGEILNIAPEQFSNLGSAIALAGRRSVATEGEILSLTREIAQQATAAGFSAESVVGLSAALGSLRLPPERSRGALTTYFQTLNGAVAQGGQRLKDFALIVGVSTGELERMVRAGEGDEVFRGFLEGLKNLDTVDATEALDRLGLAQLRVSDVFTRLSSNINVYDDALSDSAQGYGENKELAEQYAKVVDDLNSQFMLFTNSVNALIEELSGGAVSGLAGLFSKLTEIVNVMREFANNPVAKGLFTIGLALSTTIGLYLAYRTAVALTIASTLALAGAQGALAGATGFSAVIASLRLIAPSLFALVASMRATTAATGFTTAAMGANSLAALANSRALGLMTTGQYAAAVASRVLTAAIAPLALAAAAFLAFDVTTRWNEYTQGASDATNGMFGFQDSINAAEGKTMEFFGTTVRARDGMLEFGDAVFDAGDVVLGLATGPLVVLYQALTGNFARTVDLSGAISSLTGNIDAAVGAATQFSTEAKTKTDYASNLKKVGGAAGGAAKEVRTLADYASDLAQVFSRSFDIRFGSRLAFDEITTSWRDLNEEMDEYRRRVQELTADRAIQNYFLSVATAYGDTLRAGVLSSNIADIDAELAEATANSSTELKGNSKAAITNRKRLTDLVAGYNEYIQSLASSGKSQAEINAAVAKSRAEFIAQAQALGYSNAQLRPYIKSFDDMRFAIQRVPRNITVTANTNPAQQAINEFLAKNKKGGGGGAGGGITVPIKVDADEDDARREGERAGKAFATAVKRHGKATLTFVGGSLTEGKIGTLKFLKSGGYTGDGGTSAVAGVVHGKEYVLNANATSGIGLPMLNYMNKYNSLPGFQTGGSTSGGTGSVGMGITELGPKSLGLLRDALSRDLQLYLDPTGIARLANKGNQQLAYQGA